MSTHNIYFHGEIKKISIIFWLKKGYLDIWMPKVVFDCNGSSGYQGKGS